MRAFVESLAIGGVVLLAALAAWRLVARTRIPDRQRCWAFLRAYVKVYVICYISLVGLYIVIDAFSNLDEFSRRAETATELFQIMSRFYLVHQGEFFGKLCGVIGMMAAIFTVAWLPLSGGGRSCEPSADH